MTSDDPGRHLLRAREAPGTGRRKLSAPTGMARMHLEQRSIPARAELALSGSAGAEGFVYVLEGHGTITCTTESLAIGPGDFLGLAPDERPVLSNAGATDLTVLIGFAADGG